MGVPLQREWDLNTAAHIGQSLVKQNSVLTENSKLEAMLGSAREEVPGWGGQQEAPASIPLCWDVCLPLPIPRPRASLPPARFYVSDTR